MVQESQIKKEYNQKSNNFQERPFISFMNDLGLTQNQNL